ncbi:beta-ketoacyl-[acyl-carrier-protein] synthase family protein [Ferrovum myxofaciens]|jgi:3-oxoacyl-[acyl-carrier-protein] synthase II|uniref:Nodulation protein E n=2 Tax=root TaxID=1 RepID=A0A9E6MYH1_9PROT|nr:beta-ketoacyl-[acyl-carrier-protein] synthase family protein [Ferrovum myxofaciens]NDU88323.1 beta-ketoacyl-[acyl-carrier-protein] synthase family protein [Ferrovum sp.]QKE38238.1 MAG: beta-ketoacyl-[acyl-carrier-protein] synthase family protein [Ferrovum myxofaciens]QWY75971.1 MAG: beta-ketoacyl-[acyl-carrier-protein] synthase family protein [Ferrovum myxofaciens]QWY78703.1 MAG: beta-ketoacyl-[acyl-carrier-protein] synthase family protein [Ferrovum myxofaciens]
MNTESAGVQRVVVTGVGVLSPFGEGAEVLVRALEEGHSGVRFLEVPWAKSLNSALAAPVLIPVESRFTKLRRLTLDRVAQLALLAAGEALTQAGLDFSGDEGLHCGLFWGTGIGGATTLEQAYHESFLDAQARPRPTTIVAFMANGSAGQLSIEFKIRGPSFTYSSACSSSAVALGEAFLAVRQGRVRYALAGGSEALLTLGVMKAWESLQTLAKPDPVHPETSCRPFSRDRSGFILGEGAGALILESESSAQARGATILAEIVGYGNTTDAGHITQPDAGGQARAIQEALHMARLAPDQIDAINAHGTGTVVGDGVETRALKIVFGDHAAHIPISATKALHGHLMGAAGAVEMVAALGALRRGIVPPTAHWTTPDPACDLDYVTEGARALPALNTIMSNSFGFGGNNAVLIARRYTVSP